MTTYTINTIRQHFRQLSRLKQSLIGMGLFLLLTLLVSAIAFAVFVTTFSFEGPPLVQEVALADLNGDGHLDAFLTISPNGEPYGAPDVVLFGDGNGRFSDSGQVLENYNTFAVALGDVTGDGLIDAVVGNQVYVNMGNGRFNPNGRYLDSAGMGTFRFQPSLADLDGDGTLDVFGAACCGGAIPEKQALFSEDEVWLNNEGQLTNSGRQLAQTGSNAAALGDLNGDGFVDAFVAGGKTTNADMSTTQKTPNTVWFNDGTGHFTDSGQRLGLAESKAVSLADLEGDGDLDAVVGNRGQADEIWLNDGAGLFSLSSERLGRSTTKKVFLADLNGDGTADAVMSGETSARIWLNDGTGRFSRGRRISYEAGHAITLGDVTGDDVFDIFVAGIDRYQVWRGEGNGRFTAGPLYENALGGSTESSQ